MTNAAAAKKILVNDLIAAIIAGNSVSDETIIACAYGVEYYEIARGYDGCTAENVGQYIAAMTTLRTRLTDLTAAAKAAKLAALPAVNVEVLMQIADLESRAQEHDDRDQFRQAGALRAQARALRAQVTA